MPKHEPVSDAYKLDLDRLEALEKAATPGPWGVALGIIQHGFHEGIVIGKEPNELKTIMKPNWHLLNAHADMIFTATSRNALPQLLAIARRCEALQRFKDWVHAYLDQHGIPTHPDGPHSKEGCRIGDRMDLLVRRCEAAEHERDLLKSQCDVVEVGYKARCDYLESLIASNTLATDLLHAEKHIESLQNELADARKAGEVAVALVRAELAEAVRLLRSYLPQVYPEVEAFLAKHQS